MSFNSKWTNHRHFQIEATKKIQRFGFTLNQGRLITLFSVLLLYFFHLAINSDIVLFFAVLMAFEDDACAQRFEGFL